MNGLLSGRPLFLPVFAKNVFSRRGICGKLYVMKRILVLIGMMLLLSGLALSLACGEGIEENPAPAVQTEAPEETVVALSTEAPTASPEPVTELYVQAPTDLGTVSARLMDEEIETVEIEPGMMSNADIARLITLFPGVTFRYTVKLGDRFLSPDVDTLSAEGASIAEIADALPCFTVLQIVDLGACAPQEIAEAETALGGVELLYSLRIYGREVGRDAETLDLSDLDALLPDELAAALPYLPSLKTVVLGTREDEGILELFRAADLPLAYDCVYRVSCFGQTLMSNAETLDLSKTKITDLDGLKQAIAKLPNLNRVEMIDCGLTDETMAALCDEYPEIRFIWELDLGYWGKLRTDATAFSTRYSKSETADKNRLTSDRVQYIRYCTDLVALDLGHQRLTDISFLRPLKKLRVLILADSYISDISVLGELPELEYIELFMNRISDLSPLENLTNLHDLNVCSNKISNFKPVCSIKTLQRFWYAKNDFSSKDHKMLKEALPDCVLNHIDTGTDGGWRYKVKGSKEKSEREQWKNAFFEGAPRYD